MNVVAIVTDRRRMDGLLRTAASVGGTVSVVVVGSRETATAVPGQRVDRVCWLSCPDGAPPGLFATQVATEVARYRPQLVVAGPGAAARPIIGAVAAVLRASIVPGVRTVAAAGAGITLQCTALRGRVERTAEAAAPVVAVLDVMESVPPQSVETSTPEEVRLSLSPLVAIEAAPTSPLAAPDLSRARRIVAVGRGISSVEDLTLAQDLAERLDAALGCSMPLPHERRWLSPAHCIGATGQQVSPELYLALGISGQFEHAVGARGARTIAVVNNDPGAPYFREADIGVVADLRDFLPALLEELG